VSGGDFISRSEGQLCARRGIEDRSQVVRDLRRVEKHLGAIAAADQLGLPPGGIESIANRKAAISSALLVAMYGASGARLLPTLAPREPIDAGVAKIMAAAGARAPVAPVARAMPFDMAKSPKPPAGTPTMGPRDLDAHERQVLAEVGTTRAALVAILRRVRHAAGDWPRAGVELGLAASTAKNLAGGHSKFSERVAQLLLTWDRENPVSGADTVAAAPNNAGTVTGAVKEAPPPEPIEQNSTPAPPAASVPPRDAAPKACAGVEGAADSPLAAPPPNILTPANDDPFAVALTALVKAKDETIAARAAVGAEIERLDAQLLPLQAQRAVLARRADMLVDRWTELHAALDRLQAVAK
jgi:hypothetical protein